MFKALLPGIVLLLSSPVTQAQVKDEYPTGHPLGITTDGEFASMSSDVKVYGAIYSAESCAYDPDRDLIVVPSMGMRQNVRSNDAWISLLNHDGSVHTVKWIGLQNAGQREQLSPSLVLNDPLGSTIHGGILYVADRNGGTEQDDPSMAVIRRFELATGRPMEDIRIEGSPWINDIAVADDGTIYTTQTGELGPDPDPVSFKVWKVTPAGVISVFTEGGPLFQPNGIAIDTEGNVVVANYGDARVLTFSTLGEVLITELAAQAGSDGLEIMKDGTKYVSSVRIGGVSVIRPGQEAELIAENIPSAASMCYNSDTNQLVIPMTSQNGIAFIPLD